MFIFSLFFLANSIKIVLSTTENCRHPTNASEFCVKTDYDVNKLPPEEPLNVDMDLWIHELIGVDDQTLSVSIRMAFYSFWNDSRVIRFKVGTANINLGQKNIENYFIPDFYLYSHMDFMQSKFGETDMNYLGLSPEGLMWYYAEGIVTIGCSMDFAKFPFDSHRCKFLLGSTGYSKNFMKFNTTYSYPAMEDIGIEQRPLQYWVKLENLSEEEKILNFPSGNYSVTGFWINLERKIMSHFLQIFLPSGSFVMVSWISFLMPLDAGERAGLLVTLFLVLVIEFMSVVSTSPKAKFLTAMEVWLVSCLGFVFLAVIEFGIMLLLMSKSKAKEKKMAQTNFSKHKWRSNLLNFDTITSSLTNKHRQIHKLDKISLVILPTLFILFNIAFWIKYLS